MRLKHFAGYGSINAKVSHRELNTRDNVETVEITVYGDHEYGLVRNDKYDLFNWLIVRLLPSYKNRDYYTTILEYTTNYIPDIDGQEAVKYTFKLKYWED